MKSAISTGRYQWIDILKGISIIAIMLMHYENGIFSRYICYWIGMFMVASFYLISGWLMASKEIDTWAIWWKKRKASLVMPYIYFSIIIIAFDILLCLLGEMETKILFRDIYKTCILRGIGTLWFIPALIGGEAITRVLLSVKWDKKIFIVAGALLFGALYQYWCKNEPSGDIYRIIDAPFRTLSNINGAWSFIVLGFLLNKFAGKEILQYSTLKKIVVALFILAVFSIVIMWPSSSRSCGKYLVCIGMFILCMGLDKLPGMGIWAYWGRNSLIIMVTHYSILQVVCERINYRIYDTPEMVGWAALIFFAVSLVLEIPVIFLINKFAPWLIGKKKC